MSGQNDDEGERDPGLSPRAGDVWSIPGAFGGRIVLIYDRGEREWYARSRDHRHTGMELRPGLLEREGGVYLGHEPEAPELLEYRREQLDWRAHALLELEELTPDERARVVARALEWGVASSSAVARLRSLSLALCCLCGEELGRDPRDRSDNAEGEIVYVEHGRAAWRVHARCFAREIVPAADETTALEAIGVLRSKIDDA